MKTKGVLIALAAVGAATFAAAGCDVLDHSIKGSGKIESESREAAPFTGVFINGSADVTVTYGVEQSVTVTTDDNLLPIITTEVSNGVLVIDSKEPYSSTHGVKVDVSVPKLESIGIDGSGDVRVENAPLENVPVANFIIDIDGSGNVEVPALNASATRVGIDGSGDVRLKGTGAELHAEIDGSGNIDAEGFQTLRCTAIVGGSGDIRVNATESLDATVSGSGNIYYGGNPPTVKSDVSGSGDVIKQP